MLLRRTRPNSISDSNFNSLKARKFVILFDIIDTFPYEDIWRIWLSSTNNAMNSKILDISNSSNASSNFAPATPKTATELFDIKILIYAKYPNKIQSEWVKSHLSRYVTNGSHAYLDINASHTKRIFYLIEEALSYDKSITHIMIAPSDSIPIVPLSNIYNSILVREESFMNYKLHTDKSLVCTPYMHLYI